MKAYVEELVSAGRSIRDIDQAMIERYGEQVLYDAPDREE
jgi:cytochrome c-type biogenesis protein CcmH/NrfF